VHSSVIKCTRFSTVATAQFAAGTPQLQLHSSRPELHSCNCTVRGLNSAVATAPGREQTLDHLSVTLVVLKLNLPLSFLLLKWSGEVLALSCALYATLVHSSATLEAFDLYPLTHPKSRPLARPRACTSRVALTIASRERRAHSAPRKCTALRRRSVHAEADPARPSSTGPP
jgi:hypothetical protein